MHIRIQNKKRLKHNDFDTNDVTLVYYFEPKKKNLDIRKCKTS